LLETSFLRWNAAVYVSIFGAFQSTNAGEQCGCTVYHQGIR
jgi:hypothetical protein